MPTASSLAFALAIAHSGDWTIATNAAPCSAGSASTSTEYVTVTSVNVDPTSSASAKLVSYVTVTTTVSALPSSPTALVTNTTATTSTSASPAWTSGVYTQTSTSLSGRGGTVPVKGDKLGLAFNGDAGGDWASWAAVEGSRLGWGYDWGDTVVDDFPVDQFEFVPMLWNQDSSAGMTSLVEEDFAGMGTVGNILSFNEPDNSGQANMTPVQGAEYHKAFFTADLAARYRIGAPATQFYGQWWLEEWLDACEGECLFDFIPVHAYYTDIGLIKTYVELMYATFNVPIWITEVACMNWIDGATVVCSANETVTFMTELNQFAFDNDYVERVAWFGAFAGFADTNPNGIMGTDGTPNVLGELYATTY